MIRPLPPGWTRPVESAEGADELREALSAAVRGYNTGTGGWMSTEQFADALLTGPLAPLLAKVQAVEALAAEWAESIWLNGASVELRRALGGDRG